ncbi:vacuolar sorting protein 35, putative [Babesia caballi]|uniref:Vacuolar protein sorting-associated protein 35 n=1 Tax=Babesia caballi TaxID=5871 RepID=A0AAV4LSQ5_BABCB|nr:vacuolar sorting protein 35, putative [Babesia caballi]
MRRCCSHPGDDAYGDDFGSSAIKQRKLLEEALFYVKENAYYMRQALDGNDFGEALKRGVNVVSELRTSTLTPTNYYELYMKVFNELQMLSDFMGNEAKRGMTLNQLYETVQQSCFILPRLYLLVMAGSHCIRGHVAPAKELLRDITELCRGVQHPVRGLFLRYFLIQICKDKLPDSEPDNPNGTLESFEFLMGNFKESVRLWVRMNSSCTNLFDQRRRDKQRLELGLLVGANLVRMAQLEGLDCDFYTDTALPAILEEIATVTDVSVRKYLLDCLIQAFSDEYHLKSLPKLLKVIVSSITSNDCMNVLVNLMNRLSNYFESADPQDADTSSCDVFGVFHEHLSTLDLHKGISLKGFLDFQASFVEFTTTVYPGIIEHVELILTHVVNVLQTSGIGEDHIEKEAHESIIKLLTIPLRTLGLRALEMQHNDPLLSFLPPHAHRSVARAVVDALAVSKLTIDSAEAFESFYRYLAPFFESPAGGDSARQLQEDHEYVSKFIQSIQSYDAAEQFAIYQKLFERMVKNGPMHYRHSMPALVMRSLQLVFRPFDTSGEATPSHNQAAVSDPVEIAIKVFRFVSDMLRLLQPLVPEEALKLAMLTAISVNELCVLLGLDMADGSNYERFGVMCYNFIATACIVYEEEVIESARQHRCLLYLVSSFSKITVLSEDHQSSVTMRLAKYGGGLLKLEQQCSALAHVADSFSRGRDSSRATWALQRALSLALTNQFTPPEVIRASLAPVRSVADRLQKRLNVVDLLEALDRI